MFKLRYIIIIIIIITLKLKSILKLKLKLKIIIIKLIIKVNFLKSLKYYYSNLSYILINIKIYYDII